MLSNWSSFKPGVLDILRGGVNRAYVGRLLSNSDDFITAAMADFRCPRAMIEITWANSAVDQNVVITSNDINRIDRTGQLFNGEIDSGQKWAYIHSGLLADGSFHPAPELDSEPQMGWYGSSLLSDGSGDFSVAPYITVTHDARAYTSIVVSGDSEYDEYPVDFTITYTHSGGPTVQTITGNAGRTYTNTFDFIDNVTAITLEITKWSANSTIVKLTQFAGALIERYRSDDIVELNILEESNSDTGVVPIGNVSANELDLTILNTDRRFSHGNTDSPYLPSLRSGRKIRVWLGFILPVGSTDQTGDIPGYIVETVAGEKIGYMPFGVYWSKDWISNYRSMVTTTTAYDVVYLLSQKDFLRSSNYTGTVGAIVDDILTDALTDIPDLKWSVSGDTGSISWANVSFEPKNYMEVLKDIAEATLSYTYVNRTGALVVGSRLGVDAAVETWQQIDLSVYFSYESNPKLDELINTVRVGYTKYTLGVPGADLSSDSEEYTIPGGGNLTTVLVWGTQPVVASTVNAELTNVTGSPVVVSVAATPTGGTVTVSGNPGDTYRIKVSGTTQAVQSVYSSDEVFTIPASGVFDFYVTWSKSPVETSTVSLVLTDQTGVPLITNLDVYAYGADLEVSGPAGSTFTISATGIPYELEENTETVAEDASSINIYGKREFALTGNTLVTTVAQAKAVADLLLTSYGDLRQDGSMELPASILVSVGDTLEVTEFKSDTVETKDFFLIKRQNIKYDGSMIGQIDLRRG